MATKRIGNRTVAALKCEEGEARAFLWDDAVTGFGVIAYPSGRKSYCIKYPWGGAAKRFKLGDHGHLTPDQARVEAKALLGDVARGIDPMGQRQETRQQRLLRDVAADWMKLHITKKRKPKTVEQYQAALTNHVLPGLGHLRLSAVRTADVSNLHSALSDTPVSANRCLSVVSSFWNWAILNGEAKRGSNPAVGIVRYREQGVENFLTSEQLARLSDAMVKAESEGLPWDSEKPTSKHGQKKNRRTIIDPYAVAAIRLLIFTSARPDEILTAKWEYLDRERKILFLPDSKGNKKPVYLGEEAMEVLKGISPLKDNPYIIPSLRGPRKKRPEGVSKHIPRSDLKRPWSAIRKAARLEGVRVYDLRHTFASVGTGLSLGLPLIGNLLGHKDPKTTQRYAHVASGPAHQAANLITKQIASAMSPKENKGAHKRRLTRDELTKLDKDALIELLAQ